MKSSFSYNVDFAVILRNCPTDVPIPVHTNRCMRTLFIYFILGCIVLYFPVCMHYPVYLLLCTTLVYSSESSGCVFARRVVPCIVMLDHVLCILVNIYVIEEDDDAGSG